MNGKENMWFRKIDPTVVERVMTIHDSSFNSTCSKRLKAELISPGVMRWEVVITATLDVFVEPFPFCHFSHCTVCGILAFLHSFSRCNAKKPLNTFLNIFSLCPSRPFKAFNFLVFVFAKNFKTSFKKLYILLVLDHPAT